MVERQSDLDEKLEALQDEVNLLKTEVKQTLIDLREYIMKDRTLLAQYAPPEPRPTAQRPEGAQEGQPVSVVPAVTGLPFIPPIPGVRRAGGALRDLQSEAHSSGSLDAVMMGNIIWWLGTVKRRGLSLQQITPYLEAYENSGHLPPSMAKLILRSMAELDDLETLDPSRAFSPHDYADALLQLHDIICTPGYTVDRLIPPPLPIPPAPVPEQLSAPDPDETVSEQPAPARRRGEQA